VHLEIGFGDMAKQITIKTLTTCQKALAGRWKQLSPKQKIYQGVNERLKLAHNKLSMLEGSNLLDIGSNQGLHAMAASQYCPSVKGIEVNPGAFKRSIATRKWFLKKKFNVGHVKFYHTELINFEDYRDVNAILACCVIYNMDDSNIEKFMEILKQCDKIIYQCRPARYEQVKGRSKYLDKICKTEDVVEFLKEEGFDIVDVSGVKSRWPVICGKK